MAKPPHPSQNLSAPRSIERPDIVCHNREFYVRELPEDYPYQLETSKEWTNIAIPFYEFRGRGPPPTDIGNPGDIYLQTGVETFILHVRTGTEWKVWDPLPTWGSIVPPASEFLAHPDSKGLNRYFWCDGYQLGWYALSSVRNKRSRMRLEGIYRTGSGLAEEHDPSVVAMEAIRRMLEGLEAGRIRVVGRSRKRPSSLPNGAFPPVRKKLKVLAPNIGSISNTGSWKDNAPPRKTKSYRTPTLLSNPHFSNSGVPDERTSACPSSMVHVFEIDLRNATGGEQSQQVKGLIEDKKLYEENQRLKEEVTQLTAETKRLRDGMGTYFNNLKFNSTSRSASAKVLDSVKISAEMLKSVGVELKEARCETQEVHLKLERVQLQADRQLDRMSTRLSIALAKIATRDQTISDLESDLSAAVKDVKDEQAARLLVERKYSDIVTRVAEFKAAFLD